MKNITFKYNQKGETIVEVLFAIVVIASALGGAFAIANRSNLTIQANKERYQAQLYANSQADILKAYSSTNTLTVTPPFCMKDYLPSAVSGAGQPCNFQFGGGAIYKISIKPATSFPDMYVITVTWDSLINQTGDKVELVYGI